MGKDLDVTVTDGSSGTVLEKYPDQYKEVRPVYLKFKKSEAAFKEYKDENSDNVAAVDAYKVEYGKLVDEQSKPEGTQNTSLLETLTESVAAKKAALPAN